MPGTRAAVALVPGLSLPPYGHVQEGHGASEYWDKVITDKHTDVLFQLCSLVQVWSIEQPSWTCKIDGGLAGLTWCWWAPDSRHLLTMADFSLHLTLWSLVSKSVSLIKYPKLPQSGLDFTPDGRYMALAERRDCKDVVSVFDCNSWQLVQHFPVATQDLAGLQWSPDGCVLAVWDCVLDYKVLMYSMDGRCLATYSAYEHALGVKTVTWAPSSQFLAIGSFDEKLRVLNHLTWRTVAEHAHTATVDCAGVVVYQEIESQQSLPPLTHRMASSQSHYDTVSLPVTVAASRPDPEKPNPRLGVGLASFSSDSRYLATRNDNMPCAVWVWDMLELSLVVLLLQASPVREACWDPRQPRLAIATGNGRLYLWSPAGCVSVCIPCDPSFSLTRLTWHPDGTALALLSSSHFCVCYLADSHSS